LADPCKVFSKQITYRKSILFLINKQLQILGSVLWEVTFSGVNVSLQYRRKCHAQ